METTVTAMDAAITTLTGLIGDVITLVTGNQYLMIFFVAGIFSMAIGFVKKLMGRY